MKRYVKNGSTLPKEENEAEKDQMKENRTSEKGLAGLLMTEEKVQREEVAPRNWEKRKRLVGMTGEADTEAPPATCTSITNA